MTVLLCCSRLLARFFGWEWPLIISCSLVGIETALRLVRFLLNKTIGCVQQSVRDVHWVSLLSNTVGWAL